MSDSSRQRAAVAGVRRLSGLDDAHFDITVENVGSRPDSFTAHAADGLLHIRATSPATALAAYAQLVRTSGAADVSRSGVRRPATLDGVRADVEAETAYPLRVAYNLTVAGYTTAFFGWDEWERELDLLAASGINAAHVTLGQEAVWLHAFQEFGYSEQELLSWIVPPSHQPWQWLNNIQHFGGGTTRGIVERRLDLARRVLARMADLEITPILPGFSGTVPTGFAERNPGAPIVAQGRWFMDVAGPERPDWLRSDSPEYARVAEAFYRAQRELFGVSGWWAVDLLHEGGKTGGADLAEAARGVQEAMRAAEPDYRWFVQAWAGNPKQELLDALDPDHLLVLDLTGETWERMSAFGGVPWAYGILPNYGGRNGLYGDLEAMAAAPAVLRGGRCGNLVGMTDMAEGVANNPVVWDLFHDLVWAHEPIQLDAWFERWVAARYGIADEEALAAWRVLRGSAYGPWRSGSAANTPNETMLAIMGQSVDAATVDGIELPASSIAVPMDAEGVEEALAVFEFYAGTDSIIASIPSLGANQASTVGPRMLPYPPDALIPALRSLVLFAERVDPTPSLGYDLVDVARQVLVDMARPLLARIRRAADERNEELFDEESTRFLGLVDALDEVLAAHPSFRLDTWTDAARLLGDTAAEKAQLVEWAKRLVTSWGGRDDFVLTEYSNRDWAGLVGTYYRRRWALWFAEVRAAFMGEATTPVDWYSLAEEWVTTEQQMAAAPSRSPLESARAALDVVDSLSGVE